MHILRKNEVLARTGLGHTTLYLLVKQGAFPAPIALSPRRVGWLAHEVDAWIEARIAARDCGRQREAGPAK